MKQSPSLLHPVHGGNITWAARLAGCSPSAILDFSASISPLGPPSSAIAAIQAHLSALSAYPDPAYSTLRQALGHAHELPPDWILPGNGSAELLTWASRELADLETTVLLTPAFGDYIRALNAVQASITACPLDLEPFSRPAAEMSMPIRGWDRSLQHWLTREDTPDAARCGVLLNNPHNPTGYLLGRDALLPYLRQFALVVVDEAFMDFLPPDEQQSLISLVPEFSNLVILRSLTKFYSLPGLRMGYAIAHPDRLARWQQWRDPWPVNALAEAATLAVLQAHAFQQQTWAWLPPTRTALSQGIGALPGLCPLPGAANFLLVQSGQSVVDLQRRLLQGHQILIRDCLSFAELGDRFFRVAVRTTTDNQRLLTGLATML